MSERSVKKSSKKQANVAANMAAGGTNIPPAPKVDPQGKVTPVSECTAAPREQFVPKHGEQGAINNDDLSLSDLTQQDPRASKDGGNASRDHVTRGEEDASNKEIDIKNLLREALKEMLPKKDFSGGKSSVKRTVHEISQSDSDSEECSRKRFNSDNFSVALGPVNDDDGDELEMKFTSDEEEDEEPPELVEVDKDEDEWFDEFDELLEEEQVSGPAVQAKLANITEKMIEVRFSEDRMKNVLDKIVRPKNIKNVGPPRVNASIWQRIKLDTKKQDVKFVKVTEKICKSIISSVLIAEKLQKIKEKVTDKELKSSLKDIVKDVCTNVHINTFALHGMNQVRRSFIKPDLNSAYKALCLPPEKEGLELFGSDFSSRVKELNEVRSMGSRIADNKGKPFLGRGSHTYGRGYNQSEHSTYDNMIKVSNYHNKSFEGNTMKLKNSHASSETRFHSLYVSKNSNGYICRKAGQAKLQAKYEVAEQAERGQEEPDELQTGKEVNTVRNECLDWETFKVSTIERATELTKNFAAGKLQCHLDFWQTLTNDRVILSLIQGTKIEFSDTTYRKTHSKPYVFDHEKSLKINNEITKLLEKEVIQKTNRADVMFVSNIFTRDKPDGSIRIILDLSELNESVVYKHFKMDNLDTAVNLMTKNCFMASIDWKDAYYSIPIAQEHRGYLAFEWGGGTV